MMKLDDVISQLTKLKDEHGNDKPVVLAVNEYYDDVYIIGDIERIYYDSKVSPDGAIIIVRRDYEFVNM